MIIIRRLLLLLALMFWQGGFMFYGAVVVPVGSSILQSHRTQGFITRSVTSFLNLAGVVALVAWLVELTLASEPLKVRNRLRWGIWILLVFTLASQGWLHVQLDSHLIPESFEILDQPTFRILHSEYLMISTIQWALVIFLLVLTLANWTSQDYEEDKN